MPIGYIWHFEKYRVVDFWIDHMLQCMKCLVEWKEHDPSVLASYDQHVIFYEFISFACDKTIHFLFDDE